jgi:hypothetical protein
MKSMVCSILTLKKFELVQSFRHYRPIFLSTAGFRFNDCMQGRWTSGARSTFESATGLEILKQSTSNERKIPIVIGFKFSNALSAVPPSETFRNKAKW